MAGPGGGPPRKSHTKSRNGCKTCKRRHIRCDETFPQCRNCTKHNCRCDYMDAQSTPREETSRSPESPNLMTTPEIDGEIENWRTSGIPPFPELTQCPRNDWYRFYRTDLRLIHHIAGLSIDFHRRGLSNSTVWAPKMPCFLAIAMSSDFVLSSILAFSASHLAYMTGSQETENLSFHHRGVAFQGLQNAISTFSKDNCDAILAASILLSWQASEWSSLASLQRGMQSVLDAMHPLWKGTSEVAQFLESQPAFRSVESTTDSGFLNSALRFQDENLERIDSAILNLQNIQERVQYNREYFDRITDLLSFVRQLRNDLPVQSPETAFERLQPLRTWLFWLPTKMIRGGEGELCALALLAQFFATTLVLEPLFPEIERFYFGCMAATPVEDIDNVILSRKATHPYVPEVQMAASMMEFPHHTILEYKSRIQWAQQLRPLGSFPTAHPASSYDNFHDLGYATTAPYTTALHSPPTLALSSPPFPLSNPYNHRGSSATVYTESSLLSDQGEENLSDYSRSGTLEHSPTFSPYIDELRSGISVTDAPGSLNMGLLHESPMMTLGSVAPELWT